MPCSARMSLATFRISAWGVGEAATLMVIPARSPDSAVAASPEEAAGAAEVVAPQAARLRASVPARIEEISFFMMGKLLCYQFFIFVPVLREKARFPPSHSHTGLFVNRTSFHLQVSSFSRLKAKTKAGCRIASAPRCVPSLCAQFYARESKHRLPKQTAHAHHHAKVPVAGHGPRAPFVSESGKPVMAFLGKSIA